MKFKEKQKLEKIIDEIKLLDDAKQQIDTRLKILNIQMKEFREEVSENE